MSDAVPEGISLDNWLEAPYARWSFQHVHDFVPTAVISRGAGPIAQLPTAGAELSAVPVTATDGTRTTVGAIMAATDTDGWAVAHHGALVAEEYVGTLRAHTPHLLFSVSKSMVAAVVGALHGNGAIDLEAPVTSYVPALADSGYAGASVRHLLDMRSGIAFSDNYLHPTAEVHALDAAMGWATGNGDSPGTLYDFLLTLRQKSAHGGPFEYRSCETDVLGWICEVAAGQRMPQLMAEVLWGPLGALCDATIGVDASGTGFFDGGISACLTDLIRFGSLFVRDGVALTGRQVVPAAWIADTLEGGPDSRQAFAASPGDTGMPGGMYRNQVWFPHPGSTVVLCQGMCGQMIYIDRDAAVVGAKLSSQSFAADSRMMSDTLRAFSAMAQALAG